MEALFWIISAALWGAFLNRYVRGGGLGINIPIPKMERKITGRHLTAFFYALLLGMAGHLTIAQVSAGDIAAYRIESFDWQLAFLGFAAMSFGQSFGWGGCIDLLLDKPRSADEVPQLDALTQRSERRGRFIEAGVMWFALRGLLWTFPLGLLQHSLALAVSGVLMGGAYGIGVIVFGKDKGWPISEMIWGAVLWLCICAAL